MNYTLHKRNSIVKVITYKTPNCSTKLGIIVLSTIEKSEELDKINGNNFCATAIAKERSRVIVAFKLLENDEPIPEESKKNPYYFVFDVKFDLTRKAQLVVSDHRNKDIPVHSTYTSAVSRDIIITTLLLASLNGLDILADDIGNVYLNASCKKKSPCHNRQTPIRTRK